jgi:hypothetical protein
MSADVVVDAAPDESHNELLFIVGIVFTFCLSCYLTGIMARRLWHRYQARIAIVTDRVVRKHLSLMYATMLSRIAAHKEWDVLMETSPSSSSHSFTPAPTPRTGCLALLSAEGAESWIRWRVMQHVNFHEIQLLLPHELDGLTRHCQREVRERMWFIRRRRIDDHVVRACIQVYHEYWTTIIGEYAQMLAWVRSVSE